MLIGTLMMSQMLFQIELSNLKFNREVYELLCIVFAFWNIISMIHRHISLIHTLRHAISALRCDKFRRQSSTLPAMTRGITT